VDRRRDLSPVVRRRHEIDRHGRLALRPRDLAAIGERLSVQAEQARRSASPITTASRPSAAASGQTAARAVAGG
jgi:hypothetical protein